jgi:hypothetical protein
MKDRINKLKNHADILLNAYLGLRGSIAIFKPMAYEQAVVDKHAAGARTRGFLIIRRNLFFSCVLDVTKLSFDDDKRTPSFSNLIEALKDDALRKALRDAYTRGGEFDALWDAILRDWTGYIGQPWIAPFKTIRDKWIAHLEVNAANGEYKTLDMNGFGLKWGNVEDAAKLLEPIILNLMPVICNRGHVISAVTEDYEKAGKAYWQ